ncbi:MAG: FHA domain-containing protein [Anaerolineaceae bacterium]|nr:FHA domain-containing protein [Anaerolineaceae bacterium]
MDNKIPKTPSLVLLRGSQPFRFYPLNKSIITIGRAPNNDIVIHDNSISRYHARLIFQNGQWVIEDLGSNNGVWINSVRIKAPTILLDDIKFSLGQAVQFEMELRPVAPRNIKRRRSSSKWLKPASLLGFAGGGFVLLVIAGIFAYFVFGLGGNESWIPSKSEEPPPTIEASQEDPPVEMTAEEYFQTNPEVLVMEPGPALHIPLGGSFQVKASAYDEDGVARMGLWVDGQLALTQSNPYVESSSPFYLNQEMLGTSEGTFSLVIRAYDKMGNMGESIAYYITVVAGLEPEPVAPVVYIVEKDDTLEGIAAKIGEDVQEIKDANPGVGSLEEDMIIVLPGLPALDSNPPQLPPQEQIPLLGLNPILPQGMDQLKPDEQPDQLPGQVLPVFFPDPVSLPNLAQMPKPSGLIGQVKDCKVTLNWQFSSPEAQSIEIYRRAKPGQLAAQFVAQLNPGTTQYTDTVFPGEYEYAIEAVGKKINNKVERVRSLPYNVTVKPTLDCIEDPQKMRLLFYKPVSFNAHSPSINQAHIYYSPLGLSYRRRFPIYEGKNLSVGSWSAPIEAFPLPAQLYLNPDQPFVFEVNAWGLTIDDAINGRNGVEMGRAFASINLNEIENIGLKDWIAQGSKYAFTFKLWDSDLQWTGNGWVTSGAANGIPAPTNLKLSEKNPEHKEITYDWTGDNTLIDGFIFYRSYSCPGRGTVIRAPLYGWASSNSVGFYNKNEPAGCTYRYELSAYGRYGESARSEPLEGFTRTTNQVVKVEFQTLNIKNLPSGPARGQIDISTNGNSHSGSIWIEKKGYDLNFIPMDGMVPNNRMTAFIENNTDISIGFNITNDDLRNLDCGAYLKVKTEEIKNLTKTEIRTLTSTNKQCEMSVAISAIQDFQIPGGSRPPIQADLSITRITRFGYQVYALVQGNYYEIMDDARFLLQVSWGEYCENKPPLIIGQTEHIVNAGGGTPPGLYYIDPAVDLYVNSALQKPENPTECPKKLMLRVSPVDTGGHPSYLDTREDNNENLFDIEDLRK